MGTTGSDAIKAIGEINRQYQQVKCWACKKEFLRKDMIEVGTRGVLSCKKCKEGSDWVKEITRK